MINQSIKILAQQLYSVSIEKYIHIAMQNKYLLFIGA